MNIREIIQKKYDEINDRKNDEFGMDYADAVIFENSSVFEYDIVEESVKDTLVDIKNKAVETIKKIWQAVKNFFKKLQYNLGLLITSTDTLVKKCPHDLVALFKLHASNMSANMCTYYYNPNATFTLIETIIRQSRDSILNWDSESFGDEAMEEIFAGRFDGTKIGNYDLSDPNGDIKLENVKLAAKSCIVKDPEVKIRKVSEIMDWQTFGYAIHGKEDVKNLKKGIKQTDSLFKDVVKQLESERVDYKTDDSKRGQRIKKFFDLKIKGTQTVSKVITTFMKAYLAELKKLVRFARALVKKLARKVDPTKFI